MKTKWDYTDLAPHYLNRPDYATEAIDRFCDLAELRPGATVCDVGAGSAHITKLLVAKGHSVSAVEPNGAMREIGMTVTAGQPVEWSEGTGENLFLVSDGVLHTPPVSDNNLTGITRDSAAKLAKKELGLEIVERVIRRSELYLADEVFLTGTAAHITPVGHLDSRPIGDGGVGPITQQLLDLYVGVIRGENPSYMHWCSEVPLES